MGNSSKALANFVSSKIGYLLNSRDESSVRASLAKLRRGIGKKPGSLPDIWNLTLEGLPENFLSKTDEPTRAEWAAHMAMTLFALHQQGKNPRDNPMSTPNELLGSAVRLLISRRGESAEQAIKRRFDAVVTSSSATELAHHLRGLIQLLRSESIPLSYPQLAWDLFQFQEPELRDDVRLRWGRDYYKMRKGEEDHAQ
jgi:CRISPR system Cascade subunit CasB